MKSRNTASFDYGRLVRESRKIPADNMMPSIRIAILSDAASQQLVPLLKTLFHENGVTSEFYEGAFDAVELEALNPASELYRFHPNVIILANCIHALRSRYYKIGGEGILEAESHRIQQIWDALNRHISSRIIQFNYPLPYERAFGNYDLKVPQTLYSVTAELNRVIAQSAQKHPHVLVCDIEAIASYIGRRHWFDDRMWIISKAFCRLEYLPLVAQCLVEIVLASMGRVTKCVILDLDNTLWGGVVGDDGPLGVTMDPYGDGAAFYHFQQYLLSLKKRGILLAVCSKNDHDTAIRPFVENPDMILKLEDITVFLANWDNKADNIRAIRDTIEIGLDSMVFLDDNPFERNLVRELLPEVIVPEMPEDPADYVRVLNELNLFETSTFSSEDAIRSELYRQEAGRRALKSRFSDIDDYLKSLDMRMEIARFETSKIPRIAQLIQRSNQFNLTTHRYNEAECEAMMKDEQNVLPIYACLSDRFGLHGLIAVIILQVIGKDLEIRDWLMSCRVLTRGVEEALMNRVVAIARQNGFQAVLGRYIPTTKNRMVKDFYARFGYTKTAETDNQDCWCLDPSAYQNRKNFIMETTEVIWNVTR